MQINKHMSVRCLAALLGAVGVPILFMSLFILISRHYANYNQSYDGVALLCCTLPGEVFVAIAPIKILFRVIAMILYPAVMACILFFYSIGFIAGVYNVNF